MQQNVKHGSIMLVIVIIKTFFVTHIFDTITAEYCWFALYFMQNNLDFYDKHDGDDFIQYKNVNV